MAADGLQGASEFDNERQLLSKLHHAHLVRLLGVCTSREPPLRCLVYELMPGGNVEEQLATYQVSSSVNTSQLAGDYVNTVFAPFNLARWLGSIGLALAC